MDKRPPVFKRLPPNNQGASAGYDLAANIVVGVAIGWALHHYWPVSDPWGFLGGAVLGIASGFFQLFKMQSPRKNGPGKDDEQPH